MGMGKERRQTVRFVRKLTSLTMSYRDGRGPASARAIQIWMLQRPIRMSPTRQRSSTKPPKQYSRRKATFPELQDLNNFNFLSQLDTRHWKVLVGDGRHALHRLDSSDWEAQRCWPAFRQEKPCIFTHFLTVEVVWLERAAKAPQVAHDSGLHQAFQSPSPPLCSMLPKA